MPTLVLLLIPPALLLGAWVLFRLRGRPWGRHTTNVALALLLLVYFLATFGLGLFWVSKQELPVFDLHYTFGYVTVLLVVAHVIYNWKSIALFFRRRAPRPLLEPGEKRFRPVVRLCSWSLGLGLLAFVAFLIGYEQGAQQVVLKLVVPQEEGAPSATSGYVVDLGGHQEGIGQHYHRRSSFSRHSTWDGATGFEWSSPPKSVYKALPGRPFQALPRTWRPDAGSLHTALTQRGRPLRDLDPRRSVAQADLAHLLHHTNGITEPSWQKRAAPSAGALYPTVTYLVVRDVEGLEPGLYHFAVDRHGLHQVRRGDVAAQLAPLVERGHLVARAPLSVVFTAVFHRSGWKYGARSYRYVLLDTGHVAGNLSLVAGSLGLSSAPLGRFDDARLSMLLGVDGHEEAPLLVVPLGHAARTQVADGLVWEARFRARRDLDPSLLKRLMPLVHQATSLERIGHGLGPGARAPLPAIAPIGSLTGASPLQLPTPPPATGKLAAAILARRSTRTFSSTPLDTATFSGVLRDLASGPRVAETDALRLAVFANRVAGVPKGAYLYRPEDHTLLPLRTGDLAGKVGAAALDQEVARDAHAVVAFLVDYARMRVPDGPRGYRNLALQAGLLGQNVYLSATARGGGACGIGAFYEDELSALLGVDRTREGVLYLVAFGKK